MSKPGNPDESKRKIIMDELAKLKITNSNSFDFECLKKFMEFVAITS